MAVRRLRPYDPAGDRAAVESLWQATLPAAWPVLPLGIDLLTDGLLAVEGGEPVGFVATGVATASAGITLIMVSPPRQRQGLGGRLLDAALERLGTDRPVHAGHGGDTHLWPGVPLDLPAGVAFFTGRGWLHQADCTDLIQDLRSFTAEQSSSVDTAVAAAEDQGEVREFEARHFPEWLRHVDGTTQDVLTARGTDGQLVGTLLFDGPDAPHPYGPLLGPAAGLIRCVGVAEHARGRGVGHTMVARACQVLRDRGTRSCLVDWVVRESFYEQLGFRSWRRYRLFRHPD